MSYTDFIDRKYTDSERILMTELSGGTKPAPSSHVCYTTFNPADEDVGGCGHMHREFRQAVDCVERLKKRHGEHRLVIGFNRAMNTPRIRQHFPPGENVNARNADPIDVPIDVMHYDGDGSDEPEHLDKPLRFGKHRGKTWRELTETATGRDYLKWAVQNAMERKPGSPYKSVGEQAAPVLKWWQMRQEGSGGGGGQSGQQQGDQQQGDQQQGDQQQGDQQQQAQQQAQQAAQELMDTVKTVATETAKSVTQEQLSEQADKAVSEAVEQSGPRIDEMAQAALDALAAQATPLHITTPENPDGTLIEGQHPKFELLLRTIGAGCTRVWITGPAGSGKTTAAQKVADVLAREFYLQTPVADKFEAFGFVDAGGQYQETEVYRWATAKPGAILLIDEIDASMPQAVVSLNSITDKEGWAIFPNGEKLRVPAEHIIIVTANTWGTGPDAEYVGRAGQDGAMRNRFPRRIAWGYDEQFETNITLQVVHGAKREWIEASQHIRRNLDADRIKIVWSPRDTMDLCRMLAAGIGWKDAVESSALAQLKPDQLRKAVNGVQVATS